MSVLLRSLNDNRFCIDHTGGGCTALGYYPEPDGFYLWITTDDGMSAPKKTDERCVFGVYDPDGKANWIVQGYDTVATVLANRNNLIAAGQRLFGADVVDVFADNVRAALELAGLEAEATV